MNRIVPLWACLAASSFAVADVLAPVPLFTPEQEAATFMLPKGLRAEVVASEPMVQHPVHVAFDPQGRMWVAEMRGYMPNLAGAGEARPTGRVSVLEDTDGDGRMDKSTVFLDKLVLPRSVGFAGDGVLVGSPPNLLFCRDVDGDLKADETKVIASDYGVVENPENSSNGLVYNLDNWVYNADATTRLRYLGGVQFEFSPVPNLGQFGLTRDDWGRLYFNTNSDHLRATLVPPHYSARNPKSPMSLADTQVAKEQAIFPTLAATVNRGYREGFLNQEGRLAAFTAACGPHVYRADLLPNEFYGNVFVCEATSAMVRRDILKADGLSLSVSNAYPGREFLTSNYERFRPVNLATGPDGALYVVDMHHGLIQHKMSLTEYAKEQYREKKLDKHLLTGRIFRIVPDKGVPRGRIDLAKLATPDLVAHLAHANAWHRETAQRLLVERKDPAAVTPLRAMIRSGESPVHRANVLWALVGMGKLDAETLELARKDADAHVRASAARLSESASQLAEMVADESTYVRVHAVLSLAGLTSDEAEDALVSVLDRYGSDPAVREAAVSGIAGREIALLRRLTGDHRSPGTEAWRRNVLTDVARSISRRDDAKDLTELVSLIGGEGLTDLQRGALVDAIPARRQNAYGTESLIEVPAEPSAVAKLRASASTKKGAERVAALFTWPGKPVPPRPKVKPLTAEETKLFEAGRNTYAQVCAQCHQPEGQGQEGKAPPLAGSPWVDGPESRLIRIVLHGMRGPVTVNDRTYSMEMPGLPVLGDEEIAGALTYIRRSWGHQAAPVKPEAVQSVRDWSQARRDGWTEAELLKLR